MPVGNTITSFPLLRIHIRLEQRIMPTRRHAWRRNWPHSLYLQITASNAATAGIVRVTTNIFRSNDCFRWSCCLHLHGSSTTDPSETSVRIRVQAVSNYTWHRALLYVVNTLHTTSYHRWCHTKLDKGKAKQGGASFKWTEIGSSRTHQMHHFHLGFAGSGPPHLLQFFNIYVFRTTNTHTRAFESFFGNIHVS